MSRALTVGMSGQRPPRIQYPYPSYDLCLRPLPRTPQLSFHRPSAYLKMAPCGCGLRRKKHKQTRDERLVRPSDEQPNLSGNEQGNPQGGGRSSATVNPTARNNSGNTATTNSHTSRSYSHAQHIEFRGATIHGPIAFNPQSRVRTHDSIENLGK